IAGACAQDLDCAGTNVRCDTAATCPGVCKQKSTQGGSCTGPADCTTGFCDNGTCGAATVSALVGAGADCSGLKVCSSGLTCDRATQVCRAFVREGASCTVGESRCELYTT